MKLLFKLVDRCPAKRRGEFIVTGPHQCEIRVSKARNKTVDEFLATMLHELLHFWVTLAQTHGLKISYAREHRFIFDVVPTIINRLVKFKGESRARKHSGLRG